MKDSEDHEGYYDEAKDRDVKGETSTTARVSWRETRGAKSQETRNGVEGQRESEGEEV